MITDSFITKHILVTVSVSNIECINMLVQGNHMKPNKMLKQWLAIQVLDSMWYLSWRNKLKCIFNTLCHTLTVCQWHNLSLSLWTASGLMVRLMSWTFLFPYLSILGECCSSTYQLNAVVDILVRFLTDNVNVTGAWFGVFICSALTAWSFDGLLQSFTIPGDITVNI